MELLLDAESQIETWQEVILVYNAALKQINTKLEILNDEFQHVHQYNPIEHIKSRIKTSESIVKKLRRHGYESTIENMVKYVNDIAGIRVICSFTSDIYRIAEMIRLQNDIHVIAVKDYIRLPKASGYKSYHDDGGQAVEWSENRPYGHYRDGCTGRNPSGKTCAGRCICDGNHNGFSRDESGNPERRRNRWHGRRRDHFVCGLPCGASFL